MRHIVIDSITDEMKRHINKKCSIEKIKIFYRDLRHVQEDFKNANVPKVMLQALYGEEKDDKKWM
jgi:hypothetical protein